MNGLLFFGLCFVYRLAFYILIVFEGRAKIAGISVDEVKVTAMANQLLDFMVDPKDIAALAVLLASDAPKSISGQIMPIDDEMQRT